MTYTYVYGAHATLSKMYRGGRYNSAQRHQYDSPSSWAGHANRIGLAPQQSNSSCRSISSRRVLRDCRGLNYCLQKACADALILGLQLCTWDPHTMCKHNAHVLRKSARSAVAHMLPDTPQNSTLQPCQSSRHSDTARPQLAVPQTFAGPRQCPVQAQALCSNRSWRVTLNRHCWGSMQLWLQVQSEAWSSDIMIMCSNTGRGGVPCKAVDAPVWDLLPQHVN